MTLAEDDRIAIKLRANLVEGEYIWSWTSNVFRAGAGFPELTYRQSTFLSRVLSPEKLAKRSSSFVPLVSAEVDLDRHCLALFDGRRSLGEIAEDLRLAFPDQFTGTAEALSHASKLANRYTSGRAQPTSPARDDQQ